MRLKEFKTKISEGMSFSAVKYNKEKGYWASALDAGDMYEPAAYGPDPISDPKYNPDFKPEWDLHLSNVNMRDVFHVLGYDVEDTAPINEFIAQTVQFLRKSIDKRSPEEPDDVTRHDGGGAFIDVGKREGYYQDVVMRMAKIARIGKERGATHVYAG
jgi:hypothetical protein